MCPVTMMPIWIMSYHQIDRFTSIAIKVMGVIIIIMVIMINLVIMAIMVIMVMIVPMMAS